MTAKTKNYAQYSVAEFYVHCRGVSSKEKSEKIYASVLCFVCLSINNMLMWFRVAGCGRRSLSQLLKGKRWCAPGHQSITLWATLCYRFIAVVILRLLCIAKILQHYWKKTNNQTLLFSHKNQNYGIGTTHYQSEFKANLRGVSYTFFV